MIEKIEEESLYIDKLSELFSKILTSKSVKEDIKNNQFTNYLTYLVNGEPVAFINYYIMYERAEIININVLEEYQNQKIASKLLEYMVNECISHNVKSITLEVKETNIKAIHLYEKFDFSKVAVRRKYYQGIDGILMEKELM
ncbi:ribosomal-protein-alanine N-acetyltransferase [bacterium]|nr:ribosomal-protein-alanine N-acetyltransferase [bacterium]